MLGVDAQCPLDAWLFASDTFARSSMVLGTGLARRRVGRLPKERSSKRIRSEICLSPQGELFRFPFWRVFFRDPRRGSGLAAPRQPHPEHQTGDRSTCNRKQKQKRYREPTKKIAKASKCFGKNRAHADCRATPLSARYAARPASQPDCPLLQMRLLFSHFTSIVLITSPSGLTVSN
jgi:hypothetical protein